MSLSRYAYNAVVRWSRYRRFYTKDSHIGPSRRGWIKSQPIEDKLKLYADVRVGKDINEREDKGLQRSCIWGERKYSCELSCTQAKRLQTLSMRRLMKH